MKINNKGIATGAIIAIIVVVVLAVLAIVFVPKLSGGSQSDKIAADESYITGVADTMKAAAASNPALSGQTVRVDLKSRTGQVLTVAGATSTTTPESVSAMIAALADKYPDQFLADKTAVVAPSVDVQVYTADDYVNTDGKYYGVLTLTLNTDGTVSYSSATGNLSSTFVG